MSSESGVFHHLPCFNTDHLGPQSTPEGLPRLGVPSIVTAVSRCACLANSPTLGVPYSAAVLPPFCSVPVLSSPKSYRLSHLLAPLKGTGQPSRLRLAAKHDATIPNHRRSVETSTETSPNTGLVHPSCCACRSAESSSPALCTFVALGCSNLSLSSSNCALSHDRRDTSSHRLGF